MTCTFSQFESSVISEAVLRQHHFTETDTRSKEVTKLSFIMFIYILFEAFRPDL